MMSLPFTSSYLVYTGHCLKFAMRVAVTISIEMSANLVFKVVKVLVVNCLVPVVWKVSAEMLPLIGLPLYIDASGSWSLKNCFSLGPFLERQEKDTC